MNGSMGEHSKAGKKWLVLSALTFSIFYETPHDYQHLSNINKMEILRENIYAC